MAERTDGEAGEDGGPPQILTIRSDSNLNFGILDTSLLDTRMLDDESQENHENLSTRIGDRWRRSRSAKKQVEKGVAFCEAFRTLSDETKGICIFPRRLTKTKTLDGIAAASPAVAAVEASWLAAENGHPPTLVIVKRLQRQALLDKTNLESFFRETAILKRMRHRHLANFIGVGNFAMDEFEGPGGGLLPADARKLLKSTFIVQQAVNGDTLQDVVSAQMLSDKPLYTDQDACVWMRQVAEGLSYLHSSEPQVLHGDLNLGNIILRENGNQDACLANFGLTVLKPSGGVYNDFHNVKPKTLAIGTGVLSNDPSKELSQKIMDTLRRADKAIAQGRSLTFGKSAVPSLKQTVEALHGRQSASPLSMSLVYMAPEVFNGEKISDKAEVFAFACCLYEVFTRVVTRNLVEHPSRDPRAAKLYATMVAQGYRRPMVGTQLEPIRNLLAACWAQDPKHRPDMGDVYCRLLALENGKSFLKTHEHVAAPSGCCFGVL